MQSHICLIYNFAQHYRTNIFTLMDKELSIDFVFGDKYLDVKKMDYSLLKNFKREVRNITFLRNPIYYQKGVLSLLNENYTTYLMLGEIYCLTTWLMLFRLKFSRRKIYLWSHGWYGRESVIKNIVKKIFFSLADGTFLYGNYARNLMLKEGMNNKKLHVVYNSLDYDNQLLIRKDLTQSEIFKVKFKNKYPNLIFIGRLTTVKRLDLLIYSLKELRTKSKFFNLTFIGDGEKTEYLKELVNKLNLSNFIWFYGACYEETELANLIYNADLCVSPGNVGLTAIHAMTFGTPVITHNNFPYQMPEFETIEEGRTGSFFEYNNIDSMSNAIQGWFALGIERNVIRQNCYDIIDKKWNPHYQIKVIKKNLNI